MKNGSDDSRFALQRRNYVMLIIGFVVVLIGFCLMAGGRAPNPDVFSDTIFSFRRITLAPIVILLGFFFEIYAIMHRGKSDDKQINE